MRAAAMITAKRNIRPPFQILYIRSYCDQTPTTDNQFAITNRFPFLSPSLSILGTPLSLSLYLSLYLSIRLSISCHHPSSIEFTADADMRSVREGDRLHPGSSTTGKLGVPPLHSVQPFSKYAKDQTWLKKRGTNNNQIYEDTKFMKYTFTIYHRWNFNRGNRIVCVQIIMLILQFCFPTISFDWLKLLLSTYNSIILLFVLRIGSRKSNLTIDIVINILHWWLKGILSLW